MNNLEKVTRFEIIDHTECNTCSGSGHIKIEGQPGLLECPACHGTGTPGRVVVFIDEGKMLKASLQDEGRTLKVFMNKREA